MVLDISQELTKLIDTLQFPVFIFDENLVLQYVNTSGNECLKLQKLPSNLEDHFPILKNFLNDFKKHQHLMTIDNVNGLFNQSELFFNVTINKLHLNEFKGGILYLTNVTEKAKLKELVVRNDKLASLGLLLAGVAHEINNPVNFVNSTIHPLQADFNDILVILKKYADITPDSDVSQKLKEIDEIKTQTNFQSILDEIPQLIAAVKDGASRTAIIVKDLRTFARPDDIAMQRTDINESLQSTLTLLHHYSKDKVSIVSQYGTIPKVECISGKINQVFMNILSNAVQSIKDRGKIIIKTEQVNNDVKITITDDGMGISEENQKKIFNPFFTTKDQGEGTGLGLNISRSIIEQHKGTINFKSKTGEGTEFVITLPIKQSEGN